MATWARMMGCPAHLRIFIPFGKKCGDSYDGLSSALARCRVASLERFAGVCLCSFHALHSETILFDFLLGDFANVTDSFASNGTDFVASVLLYLDQGASIMASTFMLRSSDLAARVTSLLKMRRPWLPGDGS